MQNLQQQKLLGKYVAIQKHICMMGDSLNHYCILLKENI